MAKRKNKYVAHLAEFYHNPDTWTQQAAEYLYRQRSGAVGDVPIDTVLYEECVKGMERLPDACVDLMIADPPFGIDFDGLGSAYNRDANNVVHGYEEVREDYGIFTYAWLKEASRLLNPHASAYIFSGWNNLDEVIRSCRQLELTPINHIVWKYNFGLFTKRKFVTSHYNILFVVKNPETYYFNKVKHYPDDVWPIKREYRPGVKKNGTKLPLRLVRRLIKFSSRPGDLVFDPFMGNGTTAAAAKQLWRHFLGFEINSELRSTIESELSLVMFGESFRKFDREAHIKELRVRYPHAAVEYDRRRMHEVAENTR